MSKKVNPMAGTEAPVRSVSTLPPEPAVTRSTENPRSRDGPENPIPAALGDVVELQGERRLSEMAEGIVAALFSREGDSQGEGARDPTVLYPPVQAALAALFEEMRHRIPEASEGEMTHLVAGAAAHAAASGALDPILAETRRRASRQERRGEGEDAGWAILPLEIILKLLDPPPNLTTVSYSRKRCQRCRRRLEDTRHVRACRF